MNSAANPPEDPGAGNGAFAPEPGAEPSDKTGEYRPEAEPGLIIAGRYALQEKIGEGGMGEVWVAKQSEPVKRRVALKLIKAGMDSRAVLQRFEQERQALALMDHPHIAKVLDGGLTQDRRPFFVMELVNGLPLTRFCDEAKLGIRERLELFTPVCQAVQHAHQKGIVHRDLKPANILVTIVDGRPIPKVIDFGVAKATSGRLTDESLSTQFGAVVGTLEYMAPEQAGFSGEDVDTRADIYSLGVILYELLTGLRPIDAKGLKKAAFAEMIRVIKEQEPSKPSTRVSTDELAPSLAALRHTEPKKLAALLRGELDWVVMKCLEKQRDRRYETANGLARDIQRYLANEIVEARPPSPRYRLRKFVSRHKGRVVAASLVIFILLAGIAGVVAVQAKANRDLADKNAELAAANERERQRFDLAMESVGKFHTGVSEDVLLKQSEFEPLRKQLLGGAAEFYRKLEAQLGNAAEPRAQLALAQAYYGLGAAGRAVGSLAQAADDCGRALAIFERFAPENPEARRSAVRTLIELHLIAADRKDKTQGDRIRTRLTETTAPFAAADADPRDAILLVVALNLVGSGQTGDDGVQTLTRAAEVAERLTVAHPDVAEYHYQLARSLSNLAYRARSRGQLRECVELVARVIRACEDAQRLDPTHVQNRRIMSLASQYAGLSLGDLGRLPEALVHMERSTSTAEQLVKDQPAVIQFQRSLGVQYQNHAWCLALLGRQADSRAMLGRQTAVLETLVARHPERLPLRAELAYVLTNFGGSLEGEGKMEEAAVVLRRAADTFQELIKVRPDDADYRRFHGDALKRLGNNLANAGDNAGAIAASEQSRDAFVAAVAADSNPENRRYLASAWQTLGWVLARAGRPADGLKALKTARELAEQLQAEQPDVAENRFLVYQTIREPYFIFRDAGESVRAAETMREAQAVIERLAAEQPKNPQYTSFLASDLWSLASLERKDGHVAEARANLERSISLWERLIAANPNSPGYQSSLGSVRGNLAILEAQSGDLPKALAASRQALDECERAVAAAPGSANYKRYLGFRLVTMGYLFRLADKQGEAAPLLERALGIATSLLALRSEAALCHQLHLEARLQLGMLRLSENKAAEAASNWVEAIKTAAERASPSVDEINLQAAVHAQFSRLNDATLASALKDQSAEPKSAKAQADRAMTLLNAAVANGFADLLWLNGYDAYFPLRERDDFRALVKRLSPSAPDKK